MRWITALAIGAIIAFVLPTGFDGGTGNWMNSWAAWGTVRPLEGSHNLLFSIPLFIGAAIAFRVIFSWHSSS
ncbi:MAG TPA: hypothetical protein VHN55_01965 [Sphingomicrobium sp.]|nr:hypothetical protein [Sphingomicrobium sp.]